MILSIVLGTSLSVINAVAGYLSARVALKKNDESFSNIIFGSMIIRYFVVALVVFVSLKYLRINHLGFGLSFMISTFILIVIEIFYLNNRLNFLNLRNKSN
jgi:hypothetical protein